MPPAADAAPDLSGLADLARLDHLDLKPVILRVRTDLFLQAAGGDRAERDSFEALACGLIPIVDEETAAIVATKLAAAPFAPEAVLAALAARGGRARDIVAARARATPGLAAAGTGPVAALAARSGLGREAVADLALRGDPEIDRALAANPGTALRGEALERLVSRARRDPDLADLLLGRADLASADLAPLFLRADADRRAAIREAVEAQAALRPCPPADDIGPALVALSRVRDVKGFIAGLADGLGLPRGFLAAAAEPGARYDLLALALRAAGLREEEAVYVFLTLDEAVARQTERVFALVRLFRSLSRPAARGLVSAIVERPLRERSAAEAHRPGHAPEAAKLRAAPERAPVRAAFPVRARRTS